MFERIRTIALDAWASLLKLFDDIYVIASGINPTQSTVLWIQIIAGSLTVIWILFQIAWLRRLNEARLERYLENRIASERDALAEERAETLAHLDAVARRRGPSYALLLFWANIRLAVSFVLRMLSLGTVRGLANHTALLMQVGMLRRARRIYYDIAHDAMKKMKLYEDALANRCTEAQNALIFAGRIAVLEGRAVVAVSSFKKATRLKDDPDARLFVGQQLASPDPEGALEEFRTALSHGTIDAKPTTKAELHRSVAEILLRQGRPGLARGELRKAQTLDEPLRDYLGLAKTQTLLGDLFAARADRQAQAAQAYRAAVEYFELANDRGRAGSVRRKLRTLLKEPQAADEGWLTRLLDRWGRALLRMAARRRGRAERQED